VRGRRDGESIAFGENVHRQTERHLQLVTGRGTATAHTLAIVQTSSPVRRGISRAAGALTRAWMPLRLISEVEIWWERFGCVVADCQSREVRSARGRNRCGRRLAFSVGASLESALVGNSGTHFVKPLHSNITTYSPLTHARQQTSAARSIWRPS
jgi:hypothetical protein